MSCAWKLKPQTIFFEYMADIDAKQYLKDLSKELHKPVKHKFPTRKVFVGSKDQTWSMDLADMSVWKKENDGYTYILTIVDVFTRWAAARALKTKSAKDVLAALKDVVTESKREPRFLWVDEGKEFVNNDMKKWREENKIGMYHTYGRGKSVIVERFNRTLKTNMWKTLTAENSHSWVELLPKLITDYNSSVHSTLRMTPNEASKNPEKAGKRWQEKKKVEMPAAPTTDYKVGDIVRISRIKGMFEKGYDVSWTRQTFVIDRIDNHQFPPLYYLKDYDHHNPIQGGFYEEELQKVKHPHTFLIDHVIKERGKGDKKELFVRWLGYGPESDSWIKKEDSVLT